MDQIGVSACGPTAVYNVLCALAGRSILAINDGDEENMVTINSDAEENQDQIPLIDPETLLRLLPARIRNYEAPLIVSLDNNLFAR